jgi:hypothetical protein
MDTRKKTESRPGSYLMENKSEKPMPASKETVPKARPTMREAIIWSEILMPPLAKRKKAKPYTLPR